MKRADIRSMRSKTLLGAVLVPLLIFASVIHVPAQTVDCDAFFRDHKPNSLMSPGGRIHGVLRNKTHSSPVNPNQTITWNLEIDFRVPVASAAPTRQGDMVVFTVPKAEGHIRFLGNGSRVRWALQ